METDSEFVEEVNEIANNFVDKLANLEFFYCLETEKLAENPGPLESLMIYAVADITSFQIKRAVLGYVYDG